MTVRVGYAELAGVARSPCPRSRAPRPNPAAAASVRSGAGPEAGVGKAALEKLQSVTRAGAATARVEADF